MTVFDQFVRSTVRPPSMNGAIRLISSADRTDAPGIDARLFAITSVSVAGRRRHVDEAGALQHQRPVVLREPFGQPQLARHVRALEIERLERLRTDALDVPAVEELVRDGVEQIASPVAQSSRAA